MNARVTILLAFVFVSSQCLWPCDFGGVEKDWIDLLNEGEEKKKDDDDSHHQPELLFFRRFKLALCGADAGKLTPRAATSLANFERSTVFRPSDKKRKFEDIEIESVRRFVGCRIFKLLVRRSRTVIFTTFTVGVRKEDREGTQHLRCGHKAHQSRRHRPRSTKRRRS